MNLNDRATRLAESACQNANDLRISESAIDSATVIDFGVNVPGGLDAGLLLARICMADMARIELQAAADLDLPRHLAWPEVARGQGVT